MNPVILIERIPHSSIDCFDRTKWNSANHPPENGETIKEYEEIAAKTRLSEWIEWADVKPLFTIELSDSAMSTLADAAISGCLVRRRPRHLKEELAEVEKEVEHKVRKDGEWFVRTDSASPKDGIIAWPLSSARDVVDALSTSVRTQKGFLNRSDRVLYFFPYIREWDEQRELRVFVHQGRVTAISQYVWMHAGFFANLSDDQLQQIAEQVIEFAEFIALKLKEKNGVESITCDVYISDRERKVVRLVECNSFGYWQAAGSALFHWQRDRQLLYGNTRKNTSTSTSTKTNTGTGKNTSTNTSTKTNTGKNTSTKTSTGKNTSTKTSTGNSRREVVFRIVS